MAGRDATPLARAVARRSSHTSVSLSLSLSLAPPAAGTRAAPLRVCLFLQFCRTAGRVRHGDFCLWATGIRFRCLGVCSPTWEVRSVSCSHDRVCAPEYIVYISFQLRGTTVNPTVNLFMVVLCVEFLQAGFAAVRLPKPSSFSRCECVIKCH